MHMMQMQQNATRAAKAPVNGIFVADCVAKLLTFNDELVTTST